MRRQSLNRIHFVDLPVAEVRRDPQSEWRCVRNAGGIRTAAKLDVDWSESGSLLSRDPSIEASPELSAFVRELEEPEVLSETESSGTTPSEGETGVPDNDELARAFEILLHEFDDEC